MLTTKEYKEKLEIAQKAFQKWRTESFENRQKLLAKAADLLNAQSEELGKIITSEMNKPISQSIAEVQKCATMMNWYAKAENILKAQSVKTNLKLSEIHFEPLGVILGVMPWNFPFWQALRFAVPAVLAGNTIVLKHASICFGSGNAIEKIFSQAGFPKGVFQNLEIGHAEVEDILSNPIIQAVSLTGSEPAGAAVASTAAKFIKKSVLELGGSDAFIVLDDADLDNAAKVAALARLQNCGQTCIAAKRFIIDQQVENSFMPKFLKEFKEYIPGDPMKKDTKLGGMAREDLADDLEKQYQLALEHGAKVLIPLERVSKIAFKPGLIEVKEDNPILKEEVFGPLGLVLTGKDEHDCLRIANNTHFGLANVVWTTSKEKAMYFADHLESGVVTINGMTKSMPEMPFGGAKRSGFGTELSLMTLREFTLPKSIVGSI